MTTDYERDQVRVAAELAAGATSVVSAHGNHASCVNCGVAGHGAPQVNARGFLIPPSQEHAPLAPSAASHWVNCAGWLQMSKMFPERPDNAAGLEGTAAHFCLSEAFAGRIHPVGSLAPNGIAITQEMHEGAELFMSNVPDDALSCIHVEERTSGGSIHNDCWGTPDVYWVRHDVLHVADYKFGHGFVDEFSNWQLICYASEIITAHRGALDGIDIEFHICQPRCFNQDSPWRTWKINEIELRPFVDILRRAATAAYAPDARCKSGDHCKHCSAIVHCPAAQEAVSHATHVSRIAEASNMPVAAMGLMRGIIGDATTMLKAMADGLDIELEATIRAGASVKGWALKPGKGKTDWTVSTGEIAALGDMFGVGLKKEAVITPIQARALFTKAGVDPALLEGYVGSTTGALKLVASEEGDFRRVFG